MVSWRGRGVVDGAQEKEGGRLEGLESPTANEEAVKDKEEEGGTEDEAAEAETEAKAEVDEEVEVEEEEDGAEVVTLLATVTATASSPFGPGGFGDSDSCGWSFCCWRRRHGKSKSCWRYLLWLSRFSLLCWFWVWFSGAVLCTALTPGGLPELDKLPIVRIGGGPLRDRRKAMNEDCFRYEVLQWQLYNKNREE